MNDVSLLCEPGAIFCILPLTNLIIEPNIWHQNTFSCLEFRNFICIEWLTLFSWSYTYDTVWCCQLITISISSLLLMVVYWFRRSVVLSSLDIDILKWNFPLYVVANERNAYMTSGGLLSCIILCYRCVSSEMFCMNSQLDPELEFDREVYPLGLLPNAGVVVGVCQRMSFSACTEFPCFEPSPQAQTILHCLLRHLLQVWLKLGWWMIALGG